MTPHNSGKTRAETKTDVPTFQASCGRCGWVGRPWSHEAIVREQQAEHVCDADRAGE